MKRYILIIGLLLAGCGSSPSPQPEPSSTLATIKSNNPNNQTCSDAVQYDCGWLTLTNKTTGAIVADKLPLETTSYLIHTAAMDTYELRFNLQIEPGLVKTATAEATAK